MATGRGRMLQHWLQALGQPLRGSGAGLGRAGFSRFRKGPGVRSVAGCAAQRQHARQELHCERPSSSSSVSLDRMPSEVLLQIFSYLDAVSLLGMGCVSRRFYHLASDKESNTYLLLEKLKIESRKDSLIWIRIYSTAFTPKRLNWKVNSVEKIAVSMNLLSVEDKEAGYWKKEFIRKQIASVKAALAQVLKPVNHYTDLPLKTKEALRACGLGWAIILKGKSGKEHVMEHVNLSINHTAVSLAWYGKHWPCVATLSTLELCGVTPVFMDWYKSPTKNRPRWRSLIARYSLSHLTESTMIGCDRLVQIFCLDPGLLVGLWKKEKELAFVMANLHLHQLVERSTLGSATIPYELPPHNAFEIDSTEYGLHGYQLHIDMHSTGVSYLCVTFRSFFTKKECIENGYVKLTVIHLKNDREHLPLIGKVGFFWKTNVFDGYIQSCSVMNVTLLDEFGKPFWCFSSPVGLRPAPSRPDCPNSLGQRYYVDYADVEGRVHMELMWFAKFEEYFVVSLEVYLHFTKINHWFGTHYQG